MLARAVDRGQLPADSDLDALVSALVGPLLFRRMITHEPVDAAFAGTVTDIVLSGVGARPRGT